MIYTVGVAHSLFDNLSGKVDSVFDDLNSKDGSVLYSSGVPAVCGDDQISY